MATILADGIFKCILLNEKKSIFFTKISLKFVSHDPIDKDPALV